MDIDVEWLKLTCTDREIWSCETGSFNMTTTYSINLSVGKYYFLCYETKSSRQVRISERKLGFIFSLRFKFVWIPKHLSKGHRVNKRQEVKENVAIFHWIFGA